VPTRATVERDQWSCQPSSSSPQQASGAEHAESGLGDTLQFLLTAARLDDRFGALIDLTSPFAAATEAAQPPAVLNMPGVQQSQLDGVIAE
jgi:hypothetical protein